MSEAHILYMSDDTPVCEEPSRLGHDVVVPERTTPDKPGCKLCLPLLVKHNEEETIKDRFLAAQKTGKTTILGYDHPDLSPMRGMVYGFIFSSFIWAIIVVLFFWVAGR